ncbi:MAG: hypothetical protein M2R45_02909 [Verrucomicrobia subdivision 3 bacterium]|nr:hypothetical protein [Limisphaerales bacterium]MCS1415369.1 hypothetical protein [Limisphaerales bacterium]
MSNRFRFSFWVSFPFLALVFVAAFSAYAETEIRFNRDIRAILSDKCYRCHGPDKNARKAKLRLDIESEAKADRGGYRVIDSDHPAKSELLARITATDPNDRMPPGASGKSLSGEEIQLLIQWIGSGAEWEGHWAYLPPVKAPVPEVKNPNWWRSPIDRFIGARLEREELEPSAPADRRTLIRRAYLDLTGLPPSADVVERFVQDRDRFAFEHVVDQLLASPRFGERMAVYWLDLVRYADTVGYHGDQPYSVWPYRDYSIDAFNRNMPFDQFTREQLAGDLLDNATREQTVASGYNRLHMITAEGGAQAKEYLAKYAADRVRTTSSVWLGSTMGCAECHDHKFDPFTTKDFYSFAAFFSDLKEKGFYGGNQWEPQLPLPSESQEREMASLTAEIARLETTLTTSTESLVNGQLDWEAHIREEEQAGRLIWEPVVPREVKSIEGASLRVLADRSVLVSGKNPESDSYEVTLSVDRNRVTGIRLEALTHPSLDEESLSRGGGNFVLTDFQIEKLTKDGQVSEEVMISRAEADFSQGGFEVAKAIDSDEESGWAVDGSKKKENRTAVFTFSPPVSLGEGDTLKITLAQRSKHKQHNIGRFRLSVISIEHPGIQEIGLPTDIYRVVLAPWADRGQMEQQRLTNYYRERTPLLDNTRSWLASMKSARDRLNKEIPTMLVSQSVKPRQMRVLPRGNWMDDSGEVVQASLPAFLTGDIALEKPLSRLDLAEWMTSENNPLTARTFVNRLWKLYFGNGLSKVLDDIGSQGEWPTHPELLDWLAVEFMESGWDVKHLVRLLVTSQTYQQSSVASDYLKERDPFNRLYARQSPFRLDAEVVRDVALSVSGLRIDQIGGPSVKPYQPEGYYAQLNFPKRKYEADSGANQYRRGVYTHWQRTFLHPSLKAFDAPSREECTSERTRSNTPLQSLALLNDPSYVEAARVFAERIMSCDNYDIEARVRWAFKEAVCRKPRSAEVKILTDLFTESLDRFAEDEEAAQKLTAVGEAPVSPDCHPGELAAWTMVSRAILNLHELITRY